MLLVKKVKIYLYSFIVITVFWYIAFLVVKLPIIPSPIFIYINIFKFCRDILTIQINRVTFKI